MSTQQFLERVLGTDGYYCLFTAHKNGGIKQCFYGTVEELAEQAIKFDESGYDTYFALATLNSDESRAADNAKQMRAFFLDLDCGPDKGDKGFPNQKAALTALRAFCRAHQMKEKPTVVNSGRGLHVYWPLTEPVERAVWQPVADKFKRMCLNYDLPIDPVVPADAARVLRVVGTHNHKDSPARPVELLGGLSEPISLAQFKAVVDHFVDDAEVPQKKANNPFGGDPFMQALTGGQASRFRTILEKTKEGRGCAQLGHCAAHQPEIEEPLWRGALSIAAQCVDADIAVHAISKKHPDYDAAETTRKANATKGPYLCTSFNDLSPGVCESCPHWKKISSPIQLGKEQLRATEDDNVVFDKPYQIEAASLQEYVIPKYPFPYFRGKNGGIFLQMDDGEGDVTDVCVYHNDLYVVRRTVDPEIGDCIVMRLHLPQDGVREFIVPMTAVTSKEELRTVLSKNGAPVLKVDMVQEYTLKWVNNMTITHAADVSRRQFGWIDDDFSGFALGRTLIYKDRLELNPASPSTRDKFDMFEPRGTLDGWKQTANFFNRPGFEAYQYVMGTGFGSVLTRMTAINGSIFHFFSKLSGLGKTSAMFAGASIWADPMRYVKTENDTTNFKMLFAEVMKDLPLYLDEMTNVAPKEASDVIYKIPSGMQRGRMASSANAERFRGEPWKLICVTTGNTSLIERVSAYKDAPLAEIQRVIEFRPAETKFATKDETDKFANALQLNYGHAGIIFIQYILNNVEYVQLTLETVQKKIDMKAGLSAKNRFWSAQAACVITGLLIAKKLKLVNYDIKALTKWVVELLSNYTVETNLQSDSPLQAIAEYYLENYNSFLRIRSTDDLRSGGTGLDHLITPDATPRIELRGRVETDTNMVYILTKPLRQWCAERQMNFGWFIDELKNSPAKARMEKKRITAGTKIKLPPVSVITLSAKGWMDEANSKVDEADEEGSGQLYAQG